jgi:HAD superfamily hydrolase (TIGR01509 family)
MPIRKAVLLDLDGVLWSSVEAHRLAFEQTLREQGYQRNFPRHFFTHLAGMTTEKAFETFLKENKIPRTTQRVEIFSKRKRTLALRYLQSKTKLHPSLLPTLRKLHHRYRLALVSTGHHDSIMLFLRRSKARRLFDVVLTHRDVPVSKPSPKIYQTALRLLGIKPQEAVAVEDTVSGVRAAARSGIPVIGMRGTTPPRQLRKAGVHRIISSLAQVD